MHTDDRSDDTHPNACTHTEDTHKLNRTSSMQASATTYRLFVSQNIKSVSRALASDWLNRLEVVVNEKTVDIFPTDQYLDHIPAMIEQLGIILESENSELSMVNSVISHKALELGRLRHTQKATISQLLREYDLLACVLADYQLRSIDEFEGNAPLREVLQVSDIINSIIRLIQQYTMDAFTESYMATIEKQTDKLASFNRFVSHEIRTPLNGALLGVELLNESDELTEQQRTDLEHIRQSLLEAASVIDNVERLVAIDQSDPVDSPLRQNLPLTPLITDLCRQLSGALQTRDVSIHVPDDLGEIYLETSRLKLFLSNLLSNAIKYSDPQKQSRDVWITRKDHADGSLELNVRDNGLGIPEEQLSQVLGMRVRAHAHLDDTHSVSGEGLGLYLVAEAMRELGGTVTLESELGKGTSVKLVIPDMLH
ncbi:sensor histidine kinase [Granulosicoccus antarcticus]|uniref:histidine kinase n=1 Tax=Granulosicoccus antarcticus IMCC3135 TaxID=1192854 RepID=A0A2Z2NJZ6_9GAMM|nr:HAMP domain-containing sensor histidine kinase [Granulosicoccus antarcticus]ASJ71443.1 Aerobic respiration control sensor protein ArcB [Granulosicoccus antarcticus IMCC3135]